MEQLNDEREQQAHPAITFLNMTGDVTISWDETNREVMLKLVEEKMEQGYSFFILKPRLFGILGTKRVPADSIQQVRQAGQVVVDDATAGQMLRSAKLDDPQVEAAVSKGHANLVRGGAKGNVTYLRRAKSAAEVVSHQTVAVRPIVGG